MSILIKGIDMPKSCRTCPINSAPPRGCLIWTINDIREDKRNKDCPLIEIPTPHGRLIDWDAFNSKLDIQYAEGRGKALAPTILEEEK